MGTLRKATLILALLVLTSCERDITGPSDGYPWPDSIPVCIDCVPWVVWPSPDSIGDGWGDGAERNGDGSSQSEVSRQDL